MKSLIFNGHSFLAVFHDPYVTLVFQPILYRDGGDSFIITFLPVHVHNINIVGPLYLWGAFSGTITENRCALE